MTAPTPLTATATGTDVVKIEQPSIGDLSRQNHPRYVRDSVCFNTVNANKRSVAIDLSCGTVADVVPSLIHCAISGFGQTGPLSHIAGHHLVIQAATGGTGQPRAEVFGSNPRYSTYRTADGGAVAVSLLEARAWQSFCTAIRRPNLVRADETQADGRTDHGEHGARYREAITDYCRRHTRDARERGAVAWIDHPVEGRIPQLRTPLHQAGRAAPMPRPAPGLSEHSMAFLLEAGFDPAHVARRLTAGQVVQLDDDA